MKVFVSGPMTGIENYNFPAFNEAARFLLANGHDVVNPVDICKKYKKEVVLSDKSVLDKMIQEELDKLKTCDMICLLPGWKKSEGALKELELAILCQLKIVMLEQLMKGSV